MNLHNIPIIGGLFDDPDQAALQNKLNETSAAYSAYRPMARQAWENAKVNALGAYAGARNMLAARYGRGALPQTGYGSAMSPQMAGMGAQTLNPAEKQGSLEQDVGAGAGYGAITGATAGMGALSAPGAAVGGILGGIGGAINYATKVPKSSTTTQFPTLDPNYRSWRK